MIKSTILLNPPLNYENIFSGNYSENEIPENKIAVDKLYNGNFLKASWNGVDWVESASQNQIEAELQKKVSEKTTEIYTAYESLYTCSLARAVGKSGQGLTREQLNNLREEYGDVKKLSEAYLLDGTILNDNLFQDINDEMDLDFPDLVLNGTIDYLNLTHLANPNYMVIPNDLLTPRINKFCYLIINKYNLGEEFWTYLKGLCSKFRKRMITNLDLFEFEKFEQRIQIVRSITNDTIIEDIQLLEIIFDEI